MQPFILLRVKSKNSDHPLTFPLAQVKTEATLNGHFTERTDHINHSERDNNTDFLPLISGIYGVAFSCSYVENEKGQAEWEFQPQPHFLSSG